MLFERKIIISMINNNDIALWHIIMLQEFTQKITKREIFLFESKLTTNKLLSLDWRIQL
jgi:hypothetical protein